MNYTTRSACVDHLQAEFVLKLGKALVVNIAVCVCVCVCMCVCVCVYVCVCVCVCFT